MAFERDFPADSLNHSATLYPLLCTYVQYTHITCNEGVLLLYPSIAPYLGAAVAILGLRSPMSADRFADRNQGRLSSGTA